MYIEKENDEATRLAGEKETWKRDPYT